MDREDMAADSRILKCVVLDNQRTNAAIQRGQRNLYHRKSVRIHTPLVSESKLSASHLDLGRLETRRASDPDPGDLDLTAYYM